MTGPINLPIQTPGPNQIAGDTGASFRRVFAIWTGLAGVGIGNPVPLVKSSGVVSAVHTAVGFVTLTLAAPGAPAASSSYGWGANIPPSFNASSAAVIHTSDTVKGVALTLLAARPGAAAFAKIDTDGAGNVTAQAGAVGVSAVAIVGNTIQITLTTPASASSGDPITMSDGTGGGTFWSIATTGPTTIVATPLDKTATAINPAAVALSFAFALETQKVIDATDADGAIFFDVYTLASHEGRPVSKG